MNSVCLYVCDLIPVVPVQSTTEHGKKFKKIYNEILTQILNDWDVYQGLTGFKAGFKKS